MARRRTKTPTVPVDSPPDQDTTSPEQPVADEHSTADEPAAEEAREPDGEAVEPAEDALEELSEAAAEESGVVDEEEEPDFGEGPSADLRRAFWQRGSRFLEYLQQAQAELAEEAVHELRVSSRRLTAVLDLFAEMIGPRPMRKLRQGLKQIRRLCGDLRELQVHLDMLKEDEHLGDFYQFHQTQHAPLLKRTAKKLSKFSASKIEKKLGLIDGLVAALIEGAEPVDADLPPHLELLAQPFIETRAVAEYALQNMDLEQPATVHAARLVLKKLRYQAEFLEQISVLQGSEAVWQAIRAFHSAAGNIQDLETLTRVLDQHWAEEPPARDVQVKVLTRLWKERQPHLAGLEHPIPLDEMEIREDLVTRGSD